MKLLRRWCVQCICGSRSPGLWWSRWAAPVCTALCRSEAALTPRNHCCTCQGPPWCDSGPAEGCRAPPCLNRGSREDSGVLQSHGEIETKQRQNQMLASPRIIEMDGKQVWDHKNPKYPACPIKLCSFFFFAVMQLTDGMQHSGHSSSVVKLWGQEEGHSPGRGF